MSPAPYSHKLRVSQLNARRPTPVALPPDADTRARIAAHLGLLALPPLRLTAQVEQGCVVTLAPVTTAIAEDIRRVYSPHAATPEGDEIEMPDDEIEPLGPVIDPGEGLVEELSLALPLYPRAPGAALPGDPLAGDADAATAGDTRRPFAGLAALLRKDGDDKGN